MYAQSDYLRDLVCNAAAKSRQHPDKLPSTVVSCSA